MKQWHNNDKDGLNTNKDMAYFTKHKTTIIIWNSDQGHTLNPAPVNSPLRESHIWIEFVVGSLLCSEVFLFLFLFLVLWFSWLLKLWPYAQRWWPPFCKKWTYNTFTEHYSFSKLVYKNLIFGEVALQSLSITERTYFLHKALI